MNAITTIKGYAKTAEMSGTTLVREDLMFLFHFALRFLRVAALLAMLGLITLALKSLLEWRYADELAAAHRH